MEFSLELITHGTSIITQQDIKIEDFEPINIEIECLDCFAFYTNLLNITLIANFTEF